MASKFSQTTANADARLVKAEGNRNVPGFVLVREWPYLPAAAGSGKAVEELFTDDVGNATGTVTNPKANGDEYAGTFVYSKIESRDENIEGSSDRACTIIETLTLVTSITTHSDLADPFVQQSNVITFPMRVETDDPATGQWGEVDEMVLTYRNVSSEPASRTACMETVTDAQLKAIADALVTGTPWVYERRLFKEENDKTATFTVMFRDYTNVATADDTDGEMLTEIGKAAGGSRREINIHVKEKVTPAVADSIMSTGTAWATLGSGFSLLTLRRRNHPDGTATMYQISVKAVATTFSANAADQFEIAFWGTTIDVTKENGIVEKRVRQQWLERYYTNTQANAVKWADYTQNIQDDGWASTSYTKEKVQGNNGEAGWLTQKIHGDYRWIAYRQSAFAIGAQAKVSETL